LVAADAASGNQLNQLVELVELELQLQLRVLEPIQDHWKIRLGLGLENIKTWAWIVVHA
jgi:hypothetical protein